MGVSEDDAFVHIPLNLKVRRDDMFNKLIKPLKDNRELSSFIGILLKVYYENGTVKEEVDEYNDMNSPLNEIKDQITRIALENSKSLALVSNIKATIDGATGQGDGDKGIGNVNMSDLQLYVHQLVSQEVQKTVSQLPSFVSVGVAGSGKDVMMNAVKNSLENDAIVGDKNSSTSEETSESDLSTSIRAEGSSGIVESQTSADSLSEKTEVVVPASFSKLRHSLGR